MLRQLQLLQAIVKNLTESFVFESSGINIHYYACILLCSGYSFVRNQAIVIPSLSRIVGH